MSEIALSIYGERRGGRPKGSQRRPPGSKLSTWVEETEHNTVCEQARAQGVSVSRFVASAVREKIARARGVNGH